MEKKILTTILNNTYTLSQLRKRVNILKNYLTLRFFGNSQEWEKQANQFDPEEIAWLQNLDETFWQNFNKDNVYPIFEEIEKNLAKANILNVYLPFETNSQIAATLGQYMRKLFDRVILFDIKLDPSLIAGCALSWQGIYKDYSLRKKIADNRIQLMESFKKFLK
ncbi:hypothetical protein A3D79_00090 [Candidatus Daviesbacteria bacterium RIFCSPHIGHO2_02_FULL_39_8]|nr:MAG: hypothetical protein A3D79_00090 [Candidatus Daviesbacteria bacterium RIFCSPHIGHO2_02_FULL_39_8]